MPNWEPVEPLPAMVQAADEARKGGREVINRQVRYIAGLFKGHITAVNQAIILWSWELSFINMNGLTHPGRGCVPGRNVSTQTGCEALWDLSRPQEQQMGSTWSHPYLLLLPHRFMALVLQGTSAEPQFCVCTRYCVRKV